MPPRVHPVSWPQANARPHCPHRPKAAGSKRAQVVASATASTARAPVAPTSAASTVLGTVRPRVRAKVVEAEQGLVSGLVHSLQDLPSKLLARFGTASELAAVAKAQMPKPANKALVDQAAHFLRDLREAAQSSLDDLAKALTLEDASLLSLVESGKVGLPFDIILRMATAWAKRPGWFCAEGHPCVQPLEPGPRWTSWALAN